MAQVTNKAGSKCIIYYERGEEDCQCVGLMWMPKFIGPINYDDVYSTMAKLNHVNIRNIEIYEMVDSFGKKMEKIPVNEFSVEKDGEFWNVKVSYGKNELDLKTKKFGGVISMLRLVTNQGYDIDVVEPKKDEK